MPITLNNSGVLFNDSTTQTVAGLPLTGGSITGALTVPNNNGLTPNIISRGSTTTGMLMTDYNTVHYYTNTGTGVDCGTTMVEDAVYEMYWMLESTGNNYDMVLYPNHTTYGTSIINFSNMIYEGSSFTMNKFSASYGYFYNDHINNSTGGDDVGGRYPCGIYTIYNTRSYGKHVMYTGADTSGINHGGGWWNDNTTQWSNVGYLGSAVTGTYYAWVRRIG